MFLRQNASRFYSWSRFLGFSIFALTAEKTIQKFARNHRFDNRFQHRIGFDLSVIDSLSFRDFLPAEPALFAIKFFVVDHLLGKRERSFHRRVFAAVSLTLESIIRNCFYILPCLFVIEMFDDICIVLVEFEKFVSLSYRRNEAVKELVGKDITDKEIQKYYDENIFGDIRTKHILISIDTLDGMTTEEKNNKEKEALNKAKDIIKKLNNGEDFDKLAKEYSTDKATKDKGGDTGWFNTGDMLEEFEKAAYNLKKGTYTTTPVKTKYGYHIILKTDEKEKPSLEDKKEEIISTLASEAKSNDTALSINALVELRKEYGMNIEDDEMSKLYSTYISNSLLSAKSNSSK